MNWLLKSVFSVCYFVATVQQVNASPADYPGENIQGYIVFNGNSSATHLCLCDSGHPSEYDFTCKIYNKTDELVTLPMSGIPCSEVPHRVSAHLKIDCSSCRDCVSVDLRELSRAHNKTQASIKVYPPPEVTISSCLVLSMNVGARQLELENVKMSTKMEVAQFGIPEMPGVGGYYTVKVVYPQGFNESDCWLTYLYMDNVDLWYLPEYIMHRCSRLRSIKIQNSPITWVSVEGLMALRNIDSLTLNNCNISEFGSDALQVTLDALDRFITEVLDTNGTGAVISNNLTRRAIEKLEQIYNASGRLNIVTYLYDMMDVEGIDFTLLFGYRTINSGDRRNFSGHIPWGVGLSYLNLAFNNLTEIPYSLSLFGYLATVNLSHNQITSLYRNWICWPPPVMNTTNERTSGTNRHCYWFRASTETLKVLDLSYNKIELIGEIQPWYQVQLAELYLQNNRILTINQDAFARSRLTESLLILNLDHNELFYFLLSSLKRLEELSIQGNKLRNVQMDSVPLSPQLHRVKLANNQIFAIEKNAFRDRLLLDSIDLSNNDLEHIFYDSMQMTPRTTLGSRVVLYAKNQSRGLVCDCASVYAKIFAEENTAIIDDSIFHYPKIPDDEMSSNCLFFDPVQGKINRTLKEAKAESQRFLCNFEGSERHNAPAKYCNEGNEGNTDNKEKICWVYCTPGCSCYHNENWTFSNLQCQNKSLSLSQLLINYPVKQIDMSGISDFDSLKHFSAGTIKWKPETLSLELRFLLLRNSNVVYIEKNAFNFTHQLALVQLDGNRIQSLRKESICTFAKSLQRLTLNNNLMDTLDAEILQHECLPSLTEITLSENSWRCSCSEQWLKLHEMLLKVSKTTQVVSDFQKMTCRVDGEIAAACNTNTKWGLACDYMNNSENYKVSDEGKIIEVCKLILNAKTQRRTQNFLIVLASVLGLVLLCLAVLAVRRRHRLLAVVRVLVLLKYQRDRRQHQQVSRDALPYDAMMWASDRDQDCLVDVLNCVRSASGGDQLELCVPESFLYSDLCSCPLTYFDCPAEGAKFSGKVVVALSERFLDTQYLALCQVIRELDSVGRSPFKDIVFLRLSYHKVSLKRNRQVGPEDVEAFKTLQRILAASEIVYKSVDWEYRLIERIRNSHSPIKPAVPTGVQESESFEGVTENEEVVDITVDQEPLVSEIMRTVDVTRSRIEAAIRDWPPFHSDKVSELFILSASESGSESGDELKSISNTVVESIVRRLPGVRLGTNDSALAACWPNNFEPATPADRINSFLMKRTRQFVVLLSNGLLSWLREEAELQCEFQAFLAANTFRRRLLVILVGQVEHRANARYKALANQRLEDVESESATNWFDMSDEGVGLETLDRWLDIALFKK